MSNEYHPKPQPFTLAQAADEARRRAQEATSPVLVAFQDICWPDGKGMIYYDPGNEVFIVSPYDRRRIDSTQSMVISTGCIGQGAEQIITTYSSEPGQNN